MTDASRGWLLAFKNVMEILAEYCPQLDEDERAEVAGTLSEAQEKITKTAGQSTRESVIKP